MGNDVRTRHSMYVLSKYLPLMLAKRLTPKEALLVINAEAVTQNEWDLLKPLIDWLQVAVTCTAIKDTAFSLVARTLPPIIPLADAKFASKQKAMAERDLPGRNPTNVIRQPAGGGQPPYLGGHGNQARMVILQSLQLLLQQMQTQGAIIMTRCVKKPSEQWEGTIDLLLRLTGVTMEADLPSIWDPLG
jgi:hypothetical protein